MSESPAVLVIGGGRWARVLLAALVDLHQGGDLGAVSHHDQAELRGWLSEHELHDVSVWGDLDDALRSRTWDAAIVANLPSHHERSARQTVMAGIPTMIEKPATPTVAELDQLVVLAGEHRVPLLVGYELMYHDAVTRLQGALAEPGDQIWRVRWHEHPRIHRNGHPRIPDVSVGAVQDYLPHLLSLILAAGVSLDDAVIDSVSLNSSGVVELCLRSDGLVVFAELSRTRGPDRAVELSCADTTLEVDLLASPVPEISLLSQPLQRELAAFLEVADTGLCQQVPNAARRTTAITRLTEVAAAQLDDQRVQMLMASLRIDGQDPVSAALDDALVEWLAMPLVASGLVTTPKDLIGVHRWSRAAYRIVTELAGDPFLTAEELASTVGATGPEFRRLSDVVAAWDQGQQVLMSGGSARKYWSNTIGPLLDSGAISAVLDDESPFPLRVGIYPGLSCMFTCTFCGRVPEARYDRSLVDSGYEHFARLFREAPSGDAHRFYISGGLEPLTNPRIGQIVTTGAEHGFKLSMYTNGLMLTPTTLARQPGLWDLDILRISLYGVDAASARAVTGHPRSFDKVIQNVIDFLRLREQTGSDVRIGFNHVIVSENSDVVDRLTALIGEINATAGTVRGIDFLTLREDYAAIEEGALTTEQRELLRSALSRLRSASEAPGGSAAGLVVDLGYALDPLLDGWPPRDLRFALLDDLRPRLHPQVSVAIDVEGDVYAYREAAFPERKGADRYIIGRLAPGRCLQDVVRGWVAAGLEISPHAGDLGMLDIFDHVVTLTLRGAERDIEAGFSPRNSPVRAWRTTEPTRPRLQLAHPFPASAPAHAGADG